MANWQRQLVKIGCLPLRPQLLLHFAMQLENLRNSTNAKVINVYALQLQSVYQVYVIRFQLVLRLRCKRAQLRKFFLLGKIPRKFIAHQEKQDLLQHIQLQLDVAVGRNQLVNARQAWPQYQLPYADQTIKLLPQLVSLVPLKDLVDNLVAYTQQQLQQPPQSYLIT